MNRIQRRDKRWHVTHALMRKLKSFSQTNKQTNRPNKLSCCMAPVLPREMLKFDMFEYIKIHIALDSLMESHE